MSNPFDVEQDELARYGPDPALCEDCHVSITGVCKAHRRMLKIKVTELSGDFEDDPFAGITRADFEPSDSE